VSFSGPIVVASRGARTHARLQRKNQQRNPNWAPQTHTGQASSGPGCRLRILVDVSETCDKRHRGDLDLFVLALIESGVSTPYELRTAAGLSLGATIPALRRLLEAGLVLAAKPGPRGRADRRLTAEGLRYLKGGWRALIDEGPSGDLDADLRVALLAFCVGGDRRLAADFLRKSTARKLESLIPVEETDRPISLPPLAL
jgi:DNA-binding PadR family transcriptional regulator